MNFKKLLFIFLGIIGLFSCKIQQTLLIENTEETIHITLKNNSDKSYVIEKDLKLGFYGDININSYFLLYYNNDTIFQTENVDYQYLENGVTNFDTIKPLEERYYSINFKNYFPDYETKGKKNQFFYLVEVENEKRWLKSNKASLP